MKRFRIISFVLAFICFFQWQAKHKAASGESIGLSVAGLACTATAAVVEGFTQQWYLAIPAAGSAVLQTIDIFRIGSRKRELLESAKTYVRFGWLFLGVGIFAPILYRKSRCAKSKLGGLSSTARDIDPKAPHRLPVSEQNAAGQPATRPESE